MTIIIILFVLYIIGLAFSWFTYSMQATFGDCHFFLEIKGWDADLPKVAKPPFKIFISLFYPYYLSKIIFGYYYKDYLEWRERNPKPTKAEKVVKEETQKVDEL